jgi:hypothetical protein
MTNELHNLNQAEWLTIFTLIDKNNAEISSRPAFYEKFINAGLKYNYFSPELAQKINNFHNQNKHNNQKLISQQWSSVFKNDFNLKEHFNIFLLSDEYNHQKSLVEFIEKKIGKKETFYTLNRFFLDDDNATKYYILRKIWRELLEKYNYPINADIVKRVVNDSTSNAVSKYSNTYEIFLNFKMLVLGHTYNPNTQGLEDYIVKHSKDALFEKRGFEYLDKKQIKLNISSENIEHMPFVSNEELIYKVRLNPEYLLKKHSLTRKHSDILCKGFVGYIYKSFNQPSIINDSFVIELKCQNSNDYETIKQRVSKYILDLDKVVGFIKENNSNLNSSEMTKFLNENIDKILMKEVLDNNLNEKPLQKKLKI